MEDKNLLTYREFKDVMAEIQGAYEYSIKWNDFMHDNIAGNPNIFQPDCTEISIMLLEKMFKDSVHLITIFVKDLQFGMYNHPKLRTVSDLYDLLLENIARSTVGAEPITLESGGDA